VQPSRTDERADQPIIT